MGIAIVNTIFKVAATVILAPASGLLEKIAVATIKEKPGEADDEYEDDLLDERFLSYPPLAVEQIGKTMDRMVETAFKNLRQSVALLQSFEQEGYDKIMKREDSVDRYEDALGAYLVRLNARELSEKENRTTAKHLHCLGNIERISDHAVNIAELAKELADKRICFSEEGGKDLYVCAEAVLEIIELTGRALRENDTETARAVEPLEEVVDVLTTELKGRHIRRVQTGNCTLELGFVYNDCINNFERVADHCSNIAVAVLEAADSNLHSHDYLRAVKQSDREDYRAAISFYADKYYSRLAVKP